jgi:CheY-like chemotaxis protein
MDREGARFDILLVDDDRDIRDTIEQILTDEGFSVSTAVDGEDALTRLAGRGGLPRLILLDLMMPVMDGREFLARVQGDSRLAEIPIVIISSARDVQRESAALGTAGYLAKPIELDHLLTNVRRWIAR